MIPTRHHRRLCPPDPPPVRLRRSFPWRVRVLACAVQSLVARDVPAGVYQGGKCSIEMNAVISPLCLITAILSCLPKADGVSITGDLPLLSLARKIVIQPRHLLQISARGESELEFTSISSSLTGLKVHLSSPLPSLFPSSHLTRCQGNHPQCQRWWCRSHCLRVRHPTPNFTTTLWL